MATEDLTRRGAVELVRVTCKRLGIAVDWMEIVRGTITRYDGTFAMCEDGMERWTIRSNIKVGKHYHQNGHTAPKLRQAMARWFDQAEYLAEREAKEQAAKKREGATGEADQGTVAGA